MKKIAIVGTGLLAAAGIYAATKYKKPVADAPDSADDSNTTVLNPKAQEIINWSGSVSLSDSDRNNLQAAVKVMSETELKYVYDFIFDFFEKDVALSSKNQSILLPIFGKYKIFQDSTILKANNSNKTKPAVKTAPHSPAQVSKTKKTTAPVKTAPAKTQLQKVADLVKWLGTFKNATPAEKFHLITVVGQMNPTELADTTNYVFNYVSKGKKPTDPALLSRLKVLSKKYNIFS